MAVRTWVPRGQTPVLRVKLTRDHLSAISGITLEGRLFRASCAGLPTMPQPFGQGFTWTSEDLEHDRALAQACWQQCKEKMESGQYDIVIMDEITYALKYGWLDTGEVLSTLRQRNPKMHIVLTRRDAPQELIDYADLVTEMREIKHPYKTQGIVAQKGIEF